ncbi:MAG: hypothetical protein ACOX2O_06140 [Bdellovibrionota bacterium]|jgi:hypothetical protein
MSLLKLALISFFFAPVIVQAEVTATLNAPEYSWRPRPNGEITITAQTSSPQPLRFRFNLSNVTRYKGVALNYGDGDNFDLIFKPNQSSFLEASETTNGFSIETRTKVRTASVIIKALDGAAWGEITAETLQNGVWIPCKTTQQGGYTIPVDNNRNKIADVWEDQYAVQRSLQDSDNDDLPLSDFRGDGLTLFEEYRGFFTVTGWISTNPLQKDLFIHDPDNLGLGYFEKSGVALHFITEDQYVSNFSRSLTKNRSDAKLSDQRGLWISTKPQHLTDSFWYAKKIPGSTSTPLTTDRIIINDALVVAHSEILQRLKEVSAPATQDTFIDLYWIIAHQLSRAVGMSLAGAPLSDADCPFYGCHATQWGGATSGATNSITRFHFATHYKGRDGNWYIYPPYDSAGTEFCTSPEGTGINGGAKRRDQDQRLLPIAGSAHSKSSCLSALRLTEGYPSSETEEVEEIRTLRKEFEKGLLPQDVAPPFKAARTGSN